jgi:predicted RNA-binding Zn-ribbon protein involved in translation (DUF1610 family)
MISHEPIYLIFFIIYLIPAILVGAYAASKGRSGIGFFFISILFSWLLALIIAIVVEPRHADTETGPMPGEHRKCPYCAEFVKTDAIICKHCRSELPAVPQEIIEANAKGRCSNCRTTVLLSAYECPQCGTKIH